MCSECVASKGAPVDRVPRAARIPPHFTWNSISFLHAILGRRHDFAANPRPRNGFAQAACN